MKHKFTHNEAQKGGWARARQHAEDRKLHPSRLEKQVRKIVQELGFQIQPEYEIFTTFPQWIDVLATSEGRQIAIEVDGSHGWHGYNGKYDKMGKYDEEKARWCEAHGIRLIYVPSRIDVKAYLKKELKNETREN